MDKHAGNERNLLAPVGRRFIPILSRLHLPQPGKDVVHPQEYGGYRKSTTDTKMMKLTQELGTEDYSPVGNGTCPPP